MRLTGPISVVVGLYLTSCTGLIVDPEGAGLGEDGGVLPGDVDAGPSVDAQPPEPEEAPLASGIRIGEIEAFQTVAVAIARDGAAVSSRNAPVVEGADTLFAIRVEVDGGFTPRPIEARVIIDEVEYSSVTEVSGSSGNDPSTALHVKVPGEAITLSSVFEVSLHEVAGGLPVSGPTDGARYPAEGVAELGAVSPRGPLHLVLVPFRYNADGSGRLPPTDAAAAAYYDAFRAMFPVAEVVLTVREPVSMSANLSTSNGWSQWLSQLRAVREADAPPSNYYYYGISAPATSFAAYCGSGCIAGLGHVPSASNPFLFTSVGISFSNRLGVGTAVHEVGHTMGRYHAPCGGPSGIDSNYPYNGASIGVWGYDSVNDVLKSPSQFTDIMGYCRDQWISDYQFGAIFNRIRTVNGATQSQVSASGSYRVGLVDAAGDIAWERYATLPRPPVGGDVRVSLRSLAGSELGVADGHFFPYDHLPGGVLYMPVTDTLAPAALAPRGYTITP